uniref:Rab-GAP TBC domain-containing protein n=1 Tax=Plectus sambesii TaxID=2011161 RepID=A0A914WIR9_9BILA
MAGFSDLFKKATGALNHLRGGGVSFLGKDGDIVYSKNNVCVHPPKKTDTVDGLLHSPGYLTIHCQHDDQLGVTLILQWLPNSTLEKNPGSIRCISPRNSANDARARIKLRHLQGDKKPRRESSSDSSGSCHDTVGETTTPTSETDVEIPQDQEETDPTPTEEDAVEISVEMTGDQLTVTSSAGKTRPSTFNTTLLPAANNGGGLGVPSINVIPHTPMAPGGSGSGGDSDHSAATSGADEASDREDGGDSSPYNSSDDEGGRIAETPIGSLTGETLSSLLDRYKELADIFESSPEQFAQAHNLMLPDGIRPSDGPNDSSVDIATGRVQFHQKSPAASLFSVNLGKMRSMRLFYSNPECTCGQLVIASPEAQYKILHFHHGGLDKLAQIFEQWNAVRAKSVKEGSPSPMPDRHFGVCHPEISKGELDPEDGLYDRVDWDFWRASTNKDGGIDDNFTIRKAIFFASMDVSLRREAWPFMLRVYPWNSTREQRDTIRNDLFLEYQSIRKRRMKDCLRAGGPTWQSVENTVTKDVVRTDRKNPFYEGDDNPNMDIMKNILMNYAVMCPAIGYIQGMSDLLAPI